VRIEWLAASALGIACPLAAPPDDEVSLLEAARGKIVVFDLDHTLLDNRPRTIASLRLWAAGTEAELAVSKLEPQDVHYLVRDTLAEVDIVDSGVVDAANAYWAGRFFSNEFTALDVPVPCAASYVTELASAGATIVYLTGRAEAQLGGGTRQSLEAHDFPTGGANLLLMKDDPDRDDLDFKQETFARIEKMGDVAAAFENDPPNLSAMAARWPTARAIFLETDHDPGHAPALPSSVRRIRDYCGL
jgi:hypothetical protein